MKKVLRELTAQECDEIFRDATVKAAQEALATGLPVTGLDEQGQLVQMNPDGSKVILNAQPYTPEVNIWN